MKKYILNFALTFAMFSTIYGQVGVNTSNPQGSFHIDGKSSAATTNPTSGIPSATQLTDDFIVKSTGQMAIGTTPNDYSMLTIKSLDKQRGIMIPDINLTSNTLDLNSDGDSDVSNQPIGLMIFNTGTTFSQGYYFWNGSEWRSIDNSPLINPEITSLLCQSITMTPATYDAGEAFEGILKVPYLGGNGGTYEEAPAVFIGNGLYMALIGGKLNYGGGEALYRIYGTPTISSPNPTTITSLDFLGKMCSNINIGEGTSLNLRNLTTDNVVDISYTGDSSYTSADTLPFETIRITESGSYAFSVRLYGNIATSSAGRWPFYIYLQNGTLDNLQDAAELDIVTIAQTQAYQDYSYNVTLGGVFKAGDTVILSMNKPSSGPNWTLKQGTSRTSPVRTSLIYWKL